MEASAAASATACVLSRVMMMCVRADDVEKYSCCGTFVKFRLLALNGSAVCPC